MNFFDYHFIYKNRLDTWGVALNPKFVAKNKCVAILKTEIENPHKLTSQLNEYPRTEETIKLMKRLEIEE